MIRVLRLRGRLGNQLFQFAAAVGSGWPQPIVVDNRAAVAWGDPLFEVLRPGSVRPATQLELARLWQLPRVPRGQRKILTLQRRLESALGNPRAWDEPDGPPSLVGIPTGSLLLRGYFQNEMYFAHVSDAVRAAFVLDRRSAPRTGARVTVALSLRRGADYASRGIRLDWSYYTSAFATLHEHIGRNYHLVVTSDEAPGIADLREVTGHTAAAVTDATQRSVLAQLSALAAADHCIIPNSSFAWWGAWLGDEDAAALGRRPRHVIAPTPWPAHPGDPCPQRWHRIAAAFEPPEKA